MTMGFKISENYANLIRTFIDEINNAPDEAFDGKTYAEYFATMSEDSKSGCAALIDEICSYEDYEKADSYVDAEEAIDAVLMLGDCTPEALVDYLQKQYDEYREMEAEQSYFDYLSEKADREYETWKDQRMGLC
jgi:hypothetical protein